MHVRMYTFNMNIGQPGPTRAGTPLLNIPAFFVAISSTVEPRIRVWSKAVGCRSHVSCLTCYVILWKNAGVLRSLAEEHRNK